jgi:hypothetical protein
MYILRQLALLLGGAAAGVTGNLLLLGLESYLRCHLLVVPPSHPSC